MPPISKKPKLALAEASKISNELESYQNEIRKIKGLSESFVNEDNSNLIQYEHDYRLVEETPNEIPKNSDIKKYIREQIQLSEQRIHRRFDLLEQRLNNFFNRQTTEEPEALEEYIEQESSPQKIGTEEVDARIFPIADEETFDFFFEQLKDPEIRDVLVANRWTLTRNVSTKSYNISVKEFLRMHFELPICVKYSVSGFGAHGTKKKKLDSYSITTFVFECFNLAFPGLHTFQETTKAIVQFWGRAPDYLSKAKDQAMKREGRDLDRDINAFKILIKPENYTRNNE